MAAGGVSKGGAAGIGVGCTVAGILICCLTLYLHGRRGGQTDGRLRGIVGRLRGLCGLRGKGSDANEPSRVEELSEKPRTEAVAPSQNAPIDGVNCRIRPAHLSITTISSDSSSALSLGNSNAELQSQFQLLSHSIRCHAQTYYNTAPILDSDLGKFCDSNLPTLEELLGPSAPVDAITMDAMLQTPETRPDSIRLLLAWSILKYVQPDCEDLEQTLLPRELVECAQAMARAQKQAQQAKTAITSPPTTEPVEEPRRFSVPRKPVPGSTNASGSRVTSADTSTIRAVPNTPPSPNTAIVVEDPTIIFSKWREMSGKLFAPVYGPDGIVQTNDPREHSINELVTTLVCLLQPYVAKGYGGARVRDLEKIVKEGAALGYRLFTQRAEWEFVWSTLMADEMVVFPALVKVGDERGKRLRKSVVLSWEETVKFPEAMEREEGELA